MGKLINAYSTYETSSIIGAVAASGIIAQITPNIQVPPVAGSLLFLYMGILRIEIIQTTAVASQINLVKASTKGTATAGATQVFGNKVSAGKTRFEFGAVPNMGYVASAWTANPGVSGNIIRRTHMPATLGESTVWEWSENDPMFMNLERGVFSDPGYLLTNLNAGGATAALIVNVRWMEFNGLQQ